MEFIKSILTDTQNSKVSIYQLVDELKSINGIGNIELVIDSDELKIITENDLDATKQTQLDTIVASHKGEIIKPKIYSLVSSTQKKLHFHNIDYKTGLKTGEHLRPVYTWEHGSLIKVEWYRDEERTDKVLIAEFDYEIDPDTSNYVRRTTTRTWINNDESENPNTKITHKDYFTNPSEQLQASRTRRTNVLDNLAIKVIGILMQAASMSQADAEIAGGLLLTKYEVELAIFQRSANTVPIHTALNTDSEFTWLNTDLTPLGLSGVTLRELLIAELI